MNIFEKADATLLPGFRRELISINGNDLMCLSAGSGPPLLMLHGDPQTHLCWHHIAPKLTDRFTVILTDLRGRGESHKPGFKEGSNAYSKRDMAEEQVALMYTLGYDQFSIVAHDRGARVARRMAIDFPNKIKQLVVMDIIPSLDFYENLNAQIAHDYFYFTFLTQNYPVPDDLIKANPEDFLLLILQGLSEKEIDYSPLALKVYLTANATPEAVTAMCECFRAGYHIDQHHDLDDRENGRKITCPTLVMWGLENVVGKYFDVESIWNSWCDQASFAPMPGGHFIPEEAPVASYKALNDFLRTI